MVCWTGSLQLSSDNKRDLFIFIFIFKILVSSSSHAKLMQEGKEIWGNEITKNPMFDVM